ncbi:DUF488 domain-containing protein [Bartonella sp. A05]|uniref:DUF488 domain-containing protein n=1 Tax=Bartonella sp. A05 TaxID=2967261 RepID=UPI0022A9DE06|nr:DUF488 domain-containing protein [Bartonella sp. A05]MCZ2204432.1 DUF488 domain-containing protein [Bartonella sp. A05]
MTQQKKSLFGRQKLLLALLQAFGGRLLNTDLQKYLFLFTEMCEQDKSYEFVPYKYGCFSFQSYADRRRLEEVGAIVKTEDWQIAEDADDYISALSSSIQKKVIRFSEKFKNMKGNDLVRYIYKNYPYYAINSEIAPKIMSAEELIKIKQAKPDDKSYKFFTIGYEGQSFENYLNRLIKNNIKVLCDVRKNPLSRKYGFSKSTLSETLNKLGIEYIHFAELGIVSEKRQALHTQRDYDKLFDEYEHTTLAQNKKAVYKLLEIFSDKKRVAITCFEAKSCMCHRSRVARALSKHPSWKYDIVHI